MVAKYSYQTQLSYDVSNEEKEKAEKTLLCFDYALKSLNKATDYLDTMSVPFKDHPDIKSNELVKYRSALRIYRDSAIENFNSFKLMALKCINAMLPFSSDTQSAKLIRSFSAAIDSIEDKVNSFSGLFDSLESSTFISDINTNIQDIYNVCDELKEIIDDRIKSHLKNNIIGKSWMDSIKQDKDIKINEDQPKLVDLL